MKRSLILTTEGSHTVWCETTGETYHSMHGAVQESEHVFIRNGLVPAAARSRSLNILEMGFGTGLNALLTLQTARAHALDIRYTAVEAYPVTPELATSLNYFGFVGTELEPAFNAMHQAADGEEVDAGNMRFKKRITDIREPLPENEAFDLIYFDAFSADKQPELWQAEVFKNICEAMSPGGLIVTYAAKGSVRRAMQEAGFNVERLPGAKGKREMLRGEKKAAVAVAVAAAVPVSEPVALPVSVHDKLRFVEVVTKCQP